MTLPFRLTVFSSVHVTVLLMCLGLGPARLAAQDAQSRGNEELANARAIFEALDYENAIPALDRSIAMLEPLLASDAAVKPSLVSAYEMRARARFGLGDKEGTNADLGALLHLDPSFAFGGQVSPRVVALLDEVRATIVGSLQLTVDPSDATILLNGQQYTASPAPIPLAAAEYALEATRRGYKPVQDTIVIAAGETRQLTVAMERASAVVYLVTSPADVEVTVDGVSRGRTTAGPPGAPYQDAPDRLGVAPEAVSQPLVLEDLLQGAHTVRFSRPCHATDERRIVIDALADYKLEPVKLARAVATVDVASTPAGARIYVDGEPRGTTPASLDDVCEGTRVVELRNPQGRFVRRLEVKAGDQVKVEGTPRPAFALVPGGSGVGQALTAKVERALAGSQQITLFVPAGNGASDALAAARAPADWLAFDADGRPVGAASSVGVMARRDLSAKVTRALDVQGVAAITQPSPGSPEVVIALLAAGAGQPDVVPLIPDRLDSMTRAMARVDFAPSLVRHSLGLLAIEVADAPGAVVARVDPGGAAEKAGIKPGDVVTSVDGQPAAAPGAFKTAVDASTVGSTMTLEVLQADGTTRSASLPVAGSPRLISVGDQTLLFNPLAVVLRSRLAMATEAEQPFVRLNLGVALLRLGDYAGAREQFEAVSLPAGSGIAQGTQQYLLGLALEGMGDLPGAQRAWQAAASSEASLTEDGPAVKSLAQRKLGIQPGRSGVSQ
jgi:hypothetical protein